MFQAFSLWGRDKEEEQETQQGGGVGSESEFSALSPPPPYFSPLSDFPPHSTFPTSEAGYKLIKTGNEEAQYRTS